MTRASRRRAALPAALLLALPLRAGGQAALEPRAGESVAAVRIDAPAGDQERLARYVEIAPGSGYDPEAVRHAVELLHATGEFDDVVALARRGAAGLELRFRLAPSPRLVRVRVEGDPVAGARGLRRATRLKPREPLWPARLERAARDAGLALAAEGWLEARVTAEARPVPGGAEAVFHVQAGPRATVAQVDFEGVGPPLDETLRAFARPAPGRPFRRQQAREAAERMRRHLAERGRWRASSEAREAYDPRSAQVALTFRVEPGPFASVAFGGERLPARLRGEVTRALREGGLSNDSIEDGAERIESALRAAGHRAPSARHTEEPRPGGVALVYDVQPGPAAQVYSVRVRGMDEVEPPLDVLLLTRVDAPLQDGLVDQDARALRAALLERGYAEATVEPEVPEGGGVLPVAFRVRPGPRTRVASVEVESPEPFPADARAPLPRLAAGRPYRVAELAADRTALVTAWRDAGFLQADVAPEVELSDDRGEARVRLRVSPGARTRVDHVVVTGLQHTREAVVRRELTLAEGQPLGLQDVLDSQRRLAALGLFGRVSLRELDPEAPVHRSLLVGVEEGPRTTLSYGIGYAERELLRGSLEVTRRNLLGLNRSLTLFARGSFRGDRLLATYREPYLLGRRQELFLTGFREGEDRVSFDYRRTGGLIQSALALWPGSSLILRLQYQRTRLFNVDVPLPVVDRQFQNSTVAGPSASLINDTRDDPLNPGRGRFLGADVQLSQKFLGGERFVKGFFQASAYLRLWPRGLLALNARLGLARTFGAGAPARVPLPDRFFAGGDYSLRGFDTDRAGPLGEVPESGERFPEGGNALLLGGAELRLDANRFLSLALFSDVGNVFPLVSDLDLRELRYTAGVGLRYKSALGPLRLDFGYKLDRRSGESPSHLHVTIGHAF